MSNLWFCQFDGAAFTKQSCPTSTLSVALSNVCARRLFADQIAFNKTWIFIVFPRQFHCIVKLILCERFIAVISIYSLHILFHSIHSLARSPYQLYDYCKSVSALINANLNSPIILLPFNALAFLAAYKMLLRRYSMARTKVICAFCMSLILLSTS